MNNLQEKKKMFYNRNFINVTDEKDFLYIFFFIYFMKKNL